MRNKIQLVNFTIISLLALLVILAGIPQVAPLIGITSSKPASYLVKDLEPFFGGRFLIGPNFSEEGNLILGQYQDGTFSVWKSSASQVQELTSSRIKDTVVKIFPGARDRKIPVLLKTTARGSSVFADIEGQQMVPGEIKTGKGNSAVFINDRLFSLDLTKHQIVEIGTYNSWPVNPNIERLEKAVSWGNDIVFLLSESYPSPLETTQLFSLNKGVILKEGSIADLLDGTNLYTATGQNLHSWDSSLSGYNTIPLCYPRFTTKIKAELKDANGRRYLFVTSLSGGDSDLLSLDDLESGCIKSPFRDRSLQFLSGIEILRTSSSSLVFKHSAGISVLDLQSQSFLYKLVDNTEVGFTAIDLNPDVLFTRFNSLGLVELFKISTSSDSKESKVGVIGRELFGVARSDNFLIFSAWRDSSSATLLNYVNGALRVTGKLESQSMGSWPRNILSFKDKAAFIASNQTRNSSTDNLFISDGTSVGTYSILSDSNQAIEKTIQKLVSFDQTLYFTNERKSGDKTIAELWKTTGEKGAELKINNITTEVGNIIDLSIRSGFAIAVFNGTQTKTIYGYSYQAPTYDVWKLTDQGSEMLYRFEIPPLILEPEENDQSDNLEFIAKNNSAIPSLYRVTRQDKKLLQSMPDYMIALAAIKINKDILVCGINGEGGSLFSVMNNETLSYAPLPKLPSQCSNILKNRDGTIAVIGHNFIRIINQDNLLESVTIDSGINQTIIGAVSHSRLYYLTYDIVQKNYSLYSLDSNKSRQLLLTSRNILPLQNSTEIGGTLYFSAQDELGIEPWVTSGDVGSTKRLDDIATGILDSMPTNYRKVGDNLFFSAFDPANGFELWTLDRCPNSSYKFSAGSCDCDVLDIDSDSDGVYDCNDSCPKDALKSESGVCGCGTPDRDINSNGIIDCKEPKIRPGAPQVATPTPKVSAPKVDYPVNNIPALKTLKAPTVKISKKQISVSFKEYNKKQVSVLAQMIGQNKSKRIKTKTGTAIFKNLAPGKWRVWYMTDSDKLLSAERVVSVKKT